MKAYRKLLQGFLEKGYQCVPFSPEPNPKKTLILRHDIDFDVKYAHQMSLVEDEMGIKSSYFFLLHSKSYNLLEAQNMAYMKSLKDRGHTISIHFDPTLYDDIEDGFAKEQALFEMLFDVEIQYTSIHRPSDYFLNHPDKICGVYHTYQPQYFEQIQYIADSQGKFRYGHPFDSESFKHGDTIQLLIHPIWWVTQAHSNIARLEEYLDYRIDAFKQHMAANCIPYREHLEASK